MCVPQEAQLARSEADRMASLAGSHSQASLLSLDTPMDDIPEEDRSLNMLSRSIWRQQRQVQNTTQFLELSPTSSASQQYDVGVSLVW